jgi:hypothetical protein
MGWQDNIKKASNLGKDFAKKAERYEARFIGGLDTRAGTVGAGAPEPDPTLKTADTGEVALRNSLDFSDIHFTFPTTAGLVSKFGKFQRVSFPAYITAFSDSFTPNWNSTPVFGRADPIPTYSNTTRAVTLGLMIPCFSKADANENLKKLNMLIKSLYPGYEEVNASGQKALDSPPLVRIKFANLLINHKNPAKGLLGYITSFSSDFGIQSKGVIMDKDSTYGYLLPRAIGFNISFSPLHESTIGWNNSAPDGEFYGNENFPYNVRKQAHEEAAKADPGIGLGDEYNEDTILGE